MSEMARCLSAIGQGKIPKVGGRRRRWTIAAAVSVAVIVLAGCMNTGGLHRSVISTGPDGLRTFSWVTESAGISHECPAVLIVNHVVGTLAGSATDETEPVWLISAAGTRLSVVWPGGFSVRFEPEAVLCDEQGVVVARAGEIVDLDQVRWESATGTFEDPYIASGSLFGRCYPFMP